MTHSTEPTPDTTPALGHTIDYTKFLDCVHCGLCTAACPTYLETGNENDGPRGRIYLMRAVVDRKIELTDRVRSHLDLCLDCRSCETACPSGVQYGRLIEPFRVEMQDAPEGRPDWFHRWFVFGLFPHRRRLDWALKPARLLQWLRLDRVIDGLGLPRLLPARIRRLYNQLPTLQRRESPLPEVLPAIGKQRARVGLFTGCVAEAMFSGTNRATARVLQHNGCEVIVPRTQQCCGAIHYHSGAAEPALLAARANLDAFAGQNLDAVIINVAGCGSMLKDYGRVGEELVPDGDPLRAELGTLADKVRDVSEFLDELGLIAPEGSIPLRAAYHDACHLRHAQRIVDPPRRILRAIPGLELIDVAEPEICCGAAGSYALTEPEMSDRLGQRKISCLTADEPDILVTANAGCLLQIQSHLRRSRGRTTPVFHPMDLLDLSYRNRQP